MKNCVPEFSIIIPVYNTVRELPRCVNSILEQKFQNFELILVDDGSSDGSGQLCDKFVAEDSRVISIHKENGGCSEARNTGVRVAKGEYLLFVDSDDMWGNINALVELDRIIKNNTGVDLICFGVEILDEKGKREKIRKPQLPSNCKKNKESITRHLVYTNQYFSTSYVKALRRNFFIENDLFFIKGLLSEDIEWSARILIDCKDISVYPKAFYKRIRRSEGSITSSIGKKNILDILNSIEKGIVFAKEKSENNRMLELYFEYWAYQYAMLFGLIQVMKDGKEYQSVIERMKKLKWLLRYDHVNKVRIVRIACKLLGIKGTITVLGMYYRLK